MEKFKQLIIRSLCWLWLRKWIGLTALLVTAVVIISLYYAYRREAILASTWIAVAGVIVTSVVLFQNWRSAKAAKKAIPQIEESIAQQKFSDAIALLGHERESVIFECIHSLLDLAKENSDYRGKVFNCLCIYIRERTIAKGYPTKYKEKPSATIQKLLDWLLIDEKYDIFSAKEGLADLSGAYLVGSDLRKARLQGSNLQKAQLRGAKLQKARLVGAQLQGARLRKANLQGARLQEANLQGAQLQGTNLTKAQLQEAQLLGAQFQEAKLEKARLLGANLQGANLQGARLQETQMQAAYMHQTLLSHKTQLGGSDLRGVSSHASETPVEIKERIESRIGQEADLDGVVFDEVLDSATPIDEDTTKTGSYNEEEALQWIEEVHHWVEEDRNMWTKATARMASLFRQET